MPSKGERVDRYLAECQVHGRWRRFNDRERDFLNELMDRRYFIRKPIEEISVKQLNWLSELSRK